MKTAVLDILEESVRVKEASIRKNLDAIAKAAETVAESIREGNKLMLFGNGGSAADAQHIAGEFVNRFLVERPPLAAIALSTDTSVITAIGNDYNFDDIFSKQVLALGKKGDIALGISTSGNSGNVVSAVETAREIGIFTIGFTGRGGKLAECADLALTVESDATPRIQETHAVMGHILCELVDRILFPEGAK